MIRAKAQRVKEHSDLGEEQSAGWGRSLGKEKGEEREQAMEGFINPALELELCLLGNWEPLKGLG